MLIFNSSILQETILQYNKIKNHLIHGNSKSDIYRSIAQYKCQMKLLSFLKKFIINIISLFTLLIIAPIIIIIFVLSSKKNESIDIKVNMNLAVMSEIINIDLLPIEILDTYSIVNKVLIKPIINRHVVHFVIKSFSLIWYRPYFLIKFLYKLIKYNSIIVKYKPAAILTFTEYSFTSSSMTAFLEEKGIKHIYFMDGEKLLNIKSSFFRFSEAWVWDEHYKLLFSKMKADKSQFIIGTPASHIELMNIQKEKLRNRKVLKYFWAAELRLEALKYIYNNLNRLRNNGFEIIIRGHPRHMRAFNKYVVPLFLEFNFENPIEKSIFDSIIDSDVILSSYSTTLYEAVISDKIAVINDYNDNIDILRKLDYNLVINRNVIPLSQFPV
jgi:hypothetical protein